MDFINSDEFLYGVISVGAVVFCVVIGCLIWYCRRRAHQSAIDDALRSSQSYVNSTQGISHTLHSDGTVTRNTITSKSLSSQDTANYANNERANNTDNNNNNNNNKHIGAGGETPSHDIVVTNGAAKLELIENATDSMNPSTNNDSDSNNNNDNKNNRHSTIDMNDGNAGTIVQGSEKQMDKDTSHDKLISSQSNNINTVKSKKNNNNNHLGSSKETKSKSMTGSAKIVKLKKGNPSQVLESENDLDTDGSIDENDEIDKILSEEIDDRTIQRLTLHKKLSNINIRTEAQNGGLIDNDDDDDDDNSLNDDLIDESNLNTIQTRSAANTLTSPPNNNINGNIDNNNNNIDTIGGLNKHRRMVSQEEINYFEQMKDENEITERGYRSRTISTTANKPNMNASLIDRT